MTVSPAIGVSPGRVTTGSLRWYVLVAGLIAERLRAQIAATPVIDDCKNGRSAWRVTVSIGVAAARPGCCTAMDLVGAADRALYAAKQPAGTGSAVLPFLPPLSSRQRQGQAGSAVRLTPDGNLRYSWNAPSWLGAATGRTSEWVGERLRRQRLRPVKDIV